MINTIFYYPDSLTFEEYQSRLNNNDIAARTIVFADALKAIYKGGKQFGATSLTDLKNQIQLIFNENPYTLPIATASRLGGIMIGDGFTIDSSTGKLNVDFSGFTNGTNGRNGLDGLIKTIFDSVTNIRASKNDYGIVKVGRGIDVVDGVISVNITDVANASVPTISAAATVDNTTGTPSVTVVKTGTNAAPTFTFNFSGIKGEKGDTGATGATGATGSSGTGTTVTYDDTELRGLIADLDSALNGLSDTADSEKDRLDDVIDGLDQNIENKINALVGDSTWLNTNIISKVLSQSNFGDEDVDEYLQQIGLYSVDNLGNKTWQWSTIAQDVNSLKTSVAALQSGVGESDLTALQSSLEQYVDTQIGTATNNLSTTYARKSAEDVIEWMYSALKQQSSADKTFNELVSAGKSDLSSAISEVRTYVEKLKNGDYIATSSIESKVDNAIAGLKNSASSNNAKTEIFNKISKNSDDISGIVTSITGDSGSAAIGTKIGNWKAGLITTANAKNKAAEAGLAVANDVTAAGIVAKINGSDDSEVYINADKIKIDGKHSLDLSSLTINVNANDINLNGQTDFLSAIGNSITAKRVVTNNTILDDNIFGGILIGDVNNGDILNPTLKISHIGTSYGYVFAKDANNTAAFTGSGIYFDIDMSSNIMNYSTHGYGDKFFKILDSDSTRYVSASADTTTVSTAQPHLEVHNGAGTYCYYYASGPTTASDMRLKNIVENINFVAEDLKDAPLFKYTTINGTDINTGTSAQYWQTIIPDAVIEGEDGYLALNYSKVATVTAITAVKEIATLKEEKAALVERVEALEARLQVIENKLNA